MVKTFSVFLLLILGLSLFAQKNIDFTKSNFRNDKAGLKKALLNIEDGDYFFDLGGANMELALGYYLRANTFNPNNAELNYKIGRTYIEAKPASEALKFLSIAKKIDPKISNELDLYIAKAYHLNLQFDDAINNYNKFKDNLSPQQSIIFANDIDKYIQECKNGKELVSNPVRVFVENLGPTINSEYPDYGAVVNIDESMIFYSSRRPNTTGGERNPLDLMYYEDAYWSITKHNEWLQSKNMGRPINTVNHDAVVGIAPDGNTLIIYRDQNSGDIFWSKNKANKWTRPHAFPKPINSNYQESSASYSYNGKRLYFVSNRPGGYGEKDIYYCDINKNGEFGKAINLGSTINTKYNEIAIFAYADGKTIYFSSEGHYGMGSYDVFKSTYENGRWTKPQNLGYPVNTPDPDVFFSIGASGRNAYYSSNREEGLGDQDIYKITFLGPEKIPVYTTNDHLIASNKMGFNQTEIDQTIQMHSSQLTLLKGIIIDEFTQKPIEATIELIDNEEGEKLASFLSNSVTGKYVISLPSGHNYGIAITAEGYLFYSENFKIPKFEKFKAVERNISLQRVEIGKAVALNNIFFDYKKAKLNKESKVELSRLIKLMQKYPNLKLEVSGHTDNVGGEDYNKKLSLERAQSVVTFLIKNNIDSSRLVAVGYGLSKPIADNDTEEGRHKNRRSEIVITGK